MNSQKDKLLFKEASVATVTAPRSNIRCVNREALPQSRGLREGTGRSAQSSDKQTPGTNEGHQKAEETPCPAE